jgi:hypothetical protein|tara:strand:+ start:28 stop:672 length:645 start_codon:yes stop_codon:yes gene_type:complete
MKFIISFIALNLLSAEYSLTTDDDKKNNYIAAVSNIDSAQYWAQTNVSLNLKDPIGLGVLIKKGQQIKINNDKRKLFFQGYNPVSNTITVKDISYKVFYTKHKKLEYNLSEIDKIQLRVDDTFKKAILLWYPNVFVHAMPLALIGGIIFRLASVEFDEDGRVERPFPRIISSALLFYGMGTGFINSWPTAKKIGKGEWLPIPLKGDSAWKIANE